jgi:ABC-2 type transport system ATP-binding protein
MQEVEAICDRVIIIKKGAIVADDSAQNLQYEDQHQVVYVEFDQNVSKSQLTKIETVSKVEQVGGNAWLIETNTSTDLRKAIAQFAQQNHILVLTMRQEERTLEEVFKALTK